MFQAKWRLTANQGTAYLQTPSLGFKDFSAMLSSEQACTLLRNLLEVTFEPDGRLRLSDALPLKTGFLQHC